MNELMLSARTTTIKYFLSRSIVGGCFAILFSTQSMAGVQVAKAGREKTNKFMTSGVVVGGLAQNDLMLKSIRRHFDSANKTERVVFDIGPTDQKSNPKRPLFFHVGIDPKPGRIVVDLEGTAEADFEIEQIVKQFEKSQIFSAPVLIKSKSDRTVTVELKFKKPLEIEVFELPGDEKSPARIVVDARTVGSKK